MLPTPPPPRIHGSAFVILYCSLGTCSYSSRCVMKWDSGGIGIKQIQISSQSVWARVGAMGYGDERQMLIGATRYLTSYSSSLKCIDAL